jgi:CheY-like chemotaxis protein
MKKPNDLNEPKIVPRSVLIVDDDLAWGESLKQLLTDNPSKQPLEITLVTSLPEAKEELSNAQYDLVITDIVLDAPGSQGGGIQLIEELKRSSPATPVIAVSGYASRFGEKLAALRVPFIEKSSSATLLEETIWATLGRPSSEPSSSASEVLRLEDIRRVFAEEASNLLVLKERTVTIAGEGQFDLSKPLQGFKRDIERKLVQFPFDRNVFLMMKFRSHNRELATYINENLGRQGFRGVRADDVDWNITDNVYNPIAVLYCCKYGIALFDEPEEGQAYSPNVAYELGIMHNQNKKCLILRHGSLPHVPFDLIKNLYVEYDRDLQLREVLDRWINEITQ